MRSQEVQLAQLVERVERVERVELVELVERTSVWSRVTSQHCLTSVMGVALPLD
jgi:hypothetical protein